MIKLLSKNNLKKNGFTFIEMLFALSIFVIAFTAVSSFLFYSYRSKDFTMSKALVIDSARRGTYNIARELREAIQSDSGTYLLESCDDFELIFYSDIDKDNQVERIRYFLEDEKLKKGVINPAGNPVDYTEEEQIDIISYYLKNNEETPLFYFYDKTYSGKETDLALDSPIPGDLLDEVTLIGIKLKIDVNPERAPEILDIETKVQLRNTKQNY